MIMRILGLVVLLIFTFTLPFSVQAKSPMVKKTIAKQAYMLDVETGMGLLAKNEDEHMPTSSMSKAMTLYLVFEALKDERISLEDSFRVSEKAWRKGGSKMFVEVDKKVKIEDLIRGVAVQSGNDATIVLAEGLAGDEESFSQTLTVKAGELGMKNSNFINASGWPDPNHYSTARDLAILGKRLILDFPEFYHYFSETEFTFSNINQKNRNPLLYRDIGADGVKTGHTESGGYGLIGSGKFGNRRVVLVLNGLESEKDRAQESARLLEWGLKSFSNVELFTKGETVEYVYTVMGKKEQIPLVIDQDLTITLPNNVRNDLKVEVVAKEPLLAPINKGDEIGKLVVEIPRVTNLEIPLYAGESVEEMGFMAATLTKMKLHLRGGAILGNEK
jgi:D-alanyl-D-alanine carboxypeptidase (penicillin-binding protein 5/6)